MTFYLWTNALFWVFIYSLNLFWLSRIGIEAVVSVAIGSAVFMLLMTPIRGIVASTYGMVGSFDKKDRAGLEKRIKQILSVSWFTSTVLVF